MFAPNPFQRRFRYCSGVVGFGLMFWLLTDVGAAEKPPDSGEQYTNFVRPLVQKHCLACHSTKVRKGSLDLERFATIDDVRKDLKAWQQTIEMLEAGEMPPAAKPQPTADERKAVIAWARDFVDVEVRAHSGDPGRVPLRRLSNAEYDDTIRDLTGVDLRPTREFPADGAAGEGFTNAAEALTDISPTLLTKYLNAAKEIADHAVFLPDGMRFSAGKTRREWTNESVAHLRQFYAAYTPDGRLHFEPYLAATIRHRADLCGKKIALDEVARREKLNAKYLAAIWRALTDTAPSYPLDVIRVKWRSATQNNVPALAAEIAAWQAVAWRFVPIGSYRYGNTVRQVSNDPNAVEAQTLRLAVKPVPGQSDVVLYLASRDLVSGNSGHPVVWRRPRLEGAGNPPLHLRDYAQFGPANEFNYASIFADTSKYLTAAAESPNGDVEEIAKRHGLDSAFLKRWLDLLALRPAETDSSWAAKSVRVIPAVPLTLLEDKTSRNDGRPAISGWRKKGTDLPILLTNSSDGTEQIPGTVQAHGVAVHPLPQEFVAAAWKSPIEGSVRVAAKIIHAHPACGNGIAWRIEHRRSDQAAILAEGPVELGKEATSPPRTIKVQKDDLVVLAIDARDGNHVCDLTDIVLTITATDKSGRVWDLAGDVADDVLAGNPHADKLGNKDTWRFVRGPSPPGSFSANTPVIPPELILGRWRATLQDPAKKDEATRLAAEVQKLLTGPRPREEMQPNRILFDNLVVFDGPLLRGLDLARLGKPRSDARQFAIPNDRFGKSPADDASVAVPPNSVTEVRLPAALFRGREFVVDVRADDPDRVTLFQVVTTPPGIDARWDGKTQVVASKNGVAYRRLLDGLTEFRNCFPQFICFPEVIPTDEAVSLKMFHREDEPLIQLFLNDEQTRQINRLWDEQRFISRQPVAENAYLPLFIGFVTQDQPKELLDYFESQRPVFLKRARDFEKDEESAVPRQMEALFAFTARAYRRPLNEKEIGDLLALFQSLRVKGAQIDEAFRGVLARVLVSPAFLFRIEQAPAGKNPGAVSDWELASRLSYFLWASAPDEELRAVALAGRLHLPKILAEQTQRMLKDPRVRGLAVEFGTQWIHVRGFEEFHEKNEQLFPNFNAELRKAINEESVLFFQDLFQSDRTVREILDADYTVLNETLAKHYGILGVTGPEWRRVDGVRKIGRGGILGLASVQAKQSGASRTSPVLRGNWVVETLLGEKLPRPPPNVPKLPENEGGDDGLTTRQRVEQHARLPECAVCHVRIDPYGFALEAYDPIGRRREKDLGGHPIDTQAKLKDGTEFTDIDGLKKYLLTKKKDVFVRQFCRKLLGYALGRSVALSDTVLIDEMVAELDRNDGRISAAILAIVRSPQFRMIRGRDFSE
jgi:Protein of unknown function (DUF1592)/Protein of unknown function (DUF1588)/Protein of unknown function (DUF1587)/Protein of unknown function (DUF1585)/Protein of unknown function (DUF1595)